MRKWIILILCVILLGGCAGKKESFDGKDRPSSRGVLRVLDGKLCGEDGKPVMLRGISSPGVSISERYITDACFRDLSRVLGANVYRLALYTWGFGTVGYCNGGNKDKLYRDILDGVEYAMKNDMYALVDWHVLQDETPMKYLDEAKDFFERISADLKDRKNVLYEICNEPNHTDWKEIKEYADIIIPIIRKNDPDALIIVGTPNWSQDVDIAADDPLSYDNIMYTMHFYSATHKEELRQKTKYALDKGLPVFVTEFGICASSGGLPRDIPEADVWIDFLEQNGISYVMWNFSKSGEACAALKASCIKLDGYIPEEDFSETGMWLYNTIRTRTGE